MKRSYSIPPDLEPVVLAKAGEGLSLRAIAAHLETAHGVKTTAPAVNRMLARIKAERAPIAKAVVQEKLAGTLTTDLDAVAGALVRAGEDEGRARKALDAVTPGEDASPVPLLVAGSLEWARCMGAASAARADLLRSLELRFRLGGASGADSFADLVLAAQRETKEK